MDLKNLPWWEKGCNSCQYLPKEELLKRINQVPLTAELVQSFLDDWVLTFHVWDAKDYYDAMVCGIYGVPNSDFKKFMLVVNSRKSLEDKAESLIHEATHVIYRTRDTEKLEPIIEGISRQLYLKDKDLFNSFVEKYLPKD